ncbi:nitronate monooxygenase [Cryobacterium sp. TMT3-29-2]|uniref:nitronate monooxygenase n=1 Tax=Cryobacterium sp. TMT3-29-2 TaxID=2555867 RepID=UPI00107359E3|nr:nitronate monooxygenase [Cryobacterium sp. TMT3-29-2]TFC84559.1 nitronate monooxygenase [Cryobacterium sp. TMT3-29-2]
MFSLTDLHVPIIAAPMAGGASTPELVRSVSAEGGLGFLAAGYKTPDALAWQITDVQRSSRRPFGVNVFVPAPPLTDRTGVEAYRQELEGTAREHGVGLPPTRDADDDGFSGKVALLIEQQVPVVSFTFGLPPAEAVDGLHAVDSCVIATVTSVREAVLAAERGVDVLCVQGPEAGGHRATFTTAEEPGTTPLPDLISAILELSKLPLIAAGGIRSGAGIAALLAAGAHAVQLGTAFLRTEESGAHQAHKDALVNPNFDRTVVTRAFSGRPARGLRNAFIAEHDTTAPRAYPQVHHLTSGLRADAGRRGDPDGLALWAGTGFRAARDEPASVVLARLWQDTSRAE